MLGSSLLSGAERLFPSSAARDPGRCRAASPNVPCGVWKENCLSSSCIRNYVRGDLVLTRALNPSGRCQPGRRVDGQRALSRPRAYPPARRAGAIRHRTTPTARRLPVRTASSSDAHRRDRSAVRDCPMLPPIVLALAARWPWVRISRGLGYGFPDFHGAERSPAPAWRSPACRARLEELYPAGSLHQPRAEAERRLDQELRRVELPWGSAGSSRLSLSVRRPRPESPTTVRRGSRGRRAPAARSRPRLVRLAVVCYLLGCSASRTSIRAPPLSSWRS